MPVTLWIVLITGIVIGIMYSRYKRKRFPITLEQQVTGLFAEEVRKQTQFGFDERKS